MIRLILSLCLVVAPAWAKLTPEQLKELPSPAAREVHFARDIQPIFEESCSKCHGRGKAKGGFAIDTRESLLKGGDSGPAVIPGNSAESLLIEMVSGLNPDNVMPEKGSRLTSEQVGLLRKWIDNNLPWDQEVFFGKLPPKNLHPRQVEPPQVAGVEHPVDRFVLAYFKEHQVTPPEVVEDRLFARRVFLDTIGLLPTPQELEAFIADKSPDKRPKLVRKLLNRNLDYAQHWLTFWNDALRNDYRGTGYIDGGRKQITTWLFAALAQNKPYNEFVSELINPTPESEGFAKGIVWRGVVNASQTPQMQAAQNISQVFMGVNLKCASCHDSFINDWTLADAYGLASIYSDEPLEMFQCDAPTGKKAKMQFIYPELGPIDAQKDKPERLRQLAQIVTGEENGRLTRTIVNRLWGRFLGRGLIEPVDEMDESSWNQDLLDWLAADLAEHDYDLKHTMERILTSRAYQLPAVPMKELNEKEFVFRGPLVRRLSAEEFFDAVAQVAGDWDRQAAAKINLAALSGKQFDPDLRDRPVQPKWIWNSASASSKADPGTVYFRKFVELEEDPSDAWLVISCDNSFALYVNGREIGSGKDHTQPVLVNAANNLRKGINLIAVAARNWPGAPSKPEVDQSNPAGLWVYARVRGSGDANSAKVMDFGTDSTWLCNVAQGTDWEKAEYPAAGWEHASELGSPNAAPWSLGATLAQSVANPDLYRKVRASLLNNDPLMTALGRPNREQVVTSRASVATTLQALELTNGPTLASHLKRVGEQWAAQEKNPDALTEAIYRRALGRKPKPQELELSRELLGQLVSPEGVEDLLWAMTMLPEFQLIY